MARTLMALIFGGLTLAAPPILAQGAPIARSFDDRTLVWGACPPIFGTACQIAVLHGDPAQANADIFLRLKAGAKLPLHWHSSAERMTLSSGQLRVKYQGTEAVTLRPGSYAYGPAKHVHEAECLSAEPCTLFIAFEGPVDAHSAAR